MRDNLPQLIQLMRRYKGECTMLKAHIKVMDKLLMDIQDEIYFSKVIELESKTIYTSFLWNIRIIVDNVKKQVIFIRDEEGYSFRWTVKTVNEIIDKLNIIIRSIN